MSAGLDQLAQGCSFRLRCESEPTFVGTMGISLLRSYARPRRLASVGGLSSARPEVSSGLGRNCKLSTCPPVANCGERACTDTHWAQGMPVAPAASTNPELRNSLWRKAEECWHFQHIELSP